jgi:hypothetical protein
LPGWRDERRKTVMSGARQRFAARRRSGFPQFAIDCKLFMMRARQPFQAAPLRHRTTQALFDAHAHASA